MLKADQAGLFVDTTRAILRAGRGTITRLRARLSMGKYASTATNMIFLYPPSLRPGAADAGEAILSGDMSLGCAPAGIGPLPTHLFTGKVPHENWARAAYGFDWLCDLIATDHRDAFTFSLQSILHFCRARLDRQSPARQPDIIGRRLLRWNLFIAQYRDDISVVDRTFILGHVQRDVRLLAQLLETSAEGYPRFEAAMGQALTALWLDNCIDLLRPAMDMLGKEFRRQILADGGPANRAPETLLNLLADTRALMAALSEREIDAPSFMDELLPRMENMLMFLTLSDGALAQFQGGNMSRAPKVAALRPAGKAKIGFKFAQRTGYQRLSGGKSTILVDSGNLPRGALAREAHLSPLALEFAHGEDRIFVNCGTCRHLGEQWNLATRGIAGHSTAHFTRNMFDPFLTDGLARKMLGPRLIAPEFTINTRRTDSDDGMWLDGQHNYFNESHGYMALRRLYLSGDGLDLRGQDRFISADKTPSHKGAEFIVRFHLHPDVTATLQSGGMACLLITRSGRGWQFRAKGPDGSALYLEPSVFIGHNGYPEKTQQIVLVSHAGDENGLRWAVKFAGQLRRRR